MACDCDSRTTSDPPLCVVAEAKLAKTGRAGEFRSAGGP